MKGFAKVYEPINHDLVQVNKIINKVIAQSDKPLHDMLKTALHSGKMIRPALILLVGKIFGPLNIEYYRLAAAIEILHVATLIHDDIIDGSELRRGKKTLSKLWLPNVAVLAGDFLLGQVVSLVVALNDLAILKIFSKTLMRVCEGEIKQEFFSSAGNTTARQRYYRDIEAKTATLFAAAAEMAALLAGATRDQVIALRRYGRELGIAFQIIDDVFDIVGREKRLGKPIVRDLRKGIMTLPIIYYLEKSGVRKSLRQQLSGRSNRINLSQARKLICESGAIEYALKEAQKNIRKSQNAIKDLPNSKVRYILNDLADCVIRQAL